jgi:hypothetical protein
VKYVDGKSLVENGVVLTGEEKTGCCPYVETGVMGGA